jgi:hypothetical protein
MASVVAQPPAAFLGALVALSSPIGRPRRVVAHPFLS